MIIPQNLASLKILNSWELHMICSSVSLRCGSSHRFSGPANSNFLFSGQMAPFILLIPEACKWLWTGTKWLTLHHFIWPFLYLHDPHHNTWIQVDNYCMDAIFFCLAVWISTCCGMLLHSFSLIKIVYLISD